MADHGDKKKKDKGKPAEYAAQLPAPAGYGPAEDPGAPHHHHHHSEECEPDHEPRVIEAEKVQRLRNLWVVVFGGDSPDEHTRMRPDSPRLEGVRVTVEGRKDYHDAHFTNPDGLVAFQGLQPQHYRVRAEEIAGYGASEWMPVDLQENDVEVRLCLPPLKGVLEVVAFHDAERCGDPKDQELIKNVGVEVFQGGLRVHSGQTDEDGLLRFEISHTGLLEIQPAVAVRAGGRNLRSLIRSRMLARVDPGQTRRIVLPYASGLGELRVSAVVETVGPDCQPEEVPLPGVRLMLFEGPTASGAPLRTATTQDQPSVFSDLGNRSYTLTVGSPGHHAGQAVELADPQQGVLHVDLSDGADLTLPPIRFHATLGRVEGSVRDASSQAGWAGIAVLIAPANGGPAHRTHTGADGDFIFHGIPAGAYILELADAKIVDTAGRRWVRADGTPARQRILVGAGVPLQLKPLLLSPDEHTLTVQVLDPGGAPLVGTEVEILEKQGPTHGTFVTDGQGQVVVQLDKAGTYRARVLNSNGLIGEAAVNEPALIRLQMRESGGAAPAPRFFPGGGDAVLDIPYPILTEGVMSAQGGWPSSAPPASADLGQQVQGALREVLNWRSSGYGGDAKGFVNALNQSFTLKQIEGHTEFTWTPRSYAAVQSGLGALTGAQASIYTRAKVALDQVLPLLEGLYPLRADADPQDTEAIRAIVRSGFTELVNELATEGGPRVLRVDDLFRQLANTTSSDPEQVRGQLGQLADLFGLQRRRVNTIDEEQNLTNFLIVVDYILGLQQSWLAQRRFFTRGGGSEPFLGTQLVLVERSLAVVSESVQEVYLAMDSVFLGREERQVVELRYPNEPPLFISELLGWIDQVASNEGPQLIKDGGKQGVISFQPTIDRLAQLADGALIPPQNPADMPAGYRTARVQRALQELADHLHEAANLVRQLGQRAA